MEDTVEDTVENTVENSVENTIEEVKDQDDVKLAAKKLTDSATYRDSVDNEEKMDNQEEGKDPMNPADIANHEPTAVKRDTNQVGSGDPV